MSKRASLIEPSSQPSQPSQESIPEANENERPTPRRSHTNLSQRPKTLRTEPSIQSTAPARRVPALSSTSSPASKQNGAKSSVPPSPTRQRASTTIANPRVPQQSLDAAAHMLASRPSDVGRQPASANVPPVPGPMLHNGGPSASPIAERRARLTTELPLPSSATAANGNTSLAAPPFPRRTATAPALPGEKRTRPRRHTNASTKDISSPILDPGQPAPIFLDVLPYSLF